MNRQRLAAAAAAGFRLRTGEALPNDSQWANVKSLNHFSGPNAAVALADSAGPAWGFLGAAQISNTQAYRGGSSLYLNGSAYISTSNAGLIVGAADFTIEMAVYPTANPAGGVLGVLWSHRTTTAGYGGALLVADSTGAMLLYVANAAGTNWQIGGVSAGFSWTLNTWQTFALTRSGSNLYTHKNGVYGATTAVTGAIANSGDFAIGVGSATGNQPITAYCDEFRKTNAARYAASNYTPWSGEFPNQ